MFLFNSNSKLEYSWFCLFSLNVKVFINNNGCTIIIKLNRINKLKYVGILEVSLKGDCHEQQPPVVRWWIIVVDRNRDTIDLTSKKIDTLALIQRYVIITYSRLRLTELGRADVKLSQVDPEIRDFGIRNYLTIRQHRIRHGRFAGLGD